jgi:ATP-dependent Clp protease protease subunit
MADEQNNLEELFQIDLADLEQEDEDTFEYEGSTLILYVNTGIERDSLKDQVKELRKVISSASTIEKVHVFINSPGGDVVEAFKLIDMMELAKQRIPVRTIVFGEAKSAGLLIAMAGTQGERYISRNSSVMSHQASMYMSNMNGRIADFEAIYEDFKKTTDSILSHYIACTGLSMEVIKADLMSHSDTALTPEEAIRYSLLDKFLHEHNILLGEE